MKKQNIIFTIVIGLLSMCSYAQSSLPFDEQYFLMDKFLINPSFTGDSDDIVFKATHRRQWDNMPNGPVTTLARDRKSTRLNSSHVAISYAVFCLKKSFEP